MALGDPFGLAVRDEFLGRRTDPCLAERDDGLIFEEPIPPYLEGRDKWTSQEREALSKAGGRILDLGCGPGRHLLDLQAAAFAVGLDRSLEVLRTCKLRGGRNLVLGSAKRLPFKEGTFDTVLLMTNGLGIAGGMPDTVQMLRDIVRVLSAKGILLAHTTDPRRESSGVEREYRLRNVGCGRPPGLVRVRLRYRDVVGPWFEILLLSPPEVEAVFSEAGLQIERSIPWEVSTIYVARRR